MHMPTHERVVAVTGASRGIGAAIAVELARRGFTVACLTRKGLGVETPVPAGLAGRLLSVQCDVTDEQSLAQAFDRVAHEAGGLHALVNNAGIHVESPSNQMSAATFEQVMATNTIAVFSACRLAYPHLLKAGAGMIVNIGSFFDRIGVKRNLAYCASKAAVGAITRCLAVEWASKGIRVIDIAPGYIQTDLNRAVLESGPLHDYLKRRIPGGAPGAAEDVARLIGALLAEDIPFLTGETIYLDGAQGIAH